MGTVNLTSSAWGGPGVPSRVERTAARYAARQSVEIAVETYIAEAKLDACVEVMEAAMRDLHQLATVVRETSEDDPAKRAVNVQLFEDGLGYCREIARNFAQRLG
jgi:hypothetical protein